MANTQHEMKEYSPEWWMEEIRTTAKQLDQDWKTSADRVVKRYLDRRQDDARESNAAGAFKYNIFWANVGILKAALYANPPRPMVTRQHNDMNDDVARVSANILERLLQNDFTKDKSEIHTSFRHAVEDRLVPGLGQVWMIYEPTIVNDVVEAVKDPQTGQVMVPEMPYKRIAKEKVLTDYVHWRDFFWSAARTWDEVWWVARRIWMRKDRIIKKYGKAKYETLRDREMAKETSTEGLPKNFRKNKYEVYEIWCKTENKVHIICGDVLLDEKDDPLKLTEFFPCPKPLMSTHSTSDLVPRPDFVMLQDQYDELDELTSRIYLLEKALRVVGVYDKTNAELVNILSNSRENEMIPVENWAALVEKGGLEGAVDWFPVEVIAAALDKLRQQKMDKIQEIYELSGISDIMRGASEPRETAAAQKIKAQYSSVRLQYSEQEVAIFVRDVLRLKGEIICGIFQPESIIEQSGIMGTDDAKLAQQAIQLLKDDGILEYKIDISEESLALPDYNAERDMRVEYTTALGQFISQTMPLVEQKPEAAPYLMKIVQWVTSGFRGSKEIESVLDEAFQAMNKPPPPPPPSPEEIKQKAETERLKMELESKERIERLKLAGQILLAKLENQSTAIENEKDRAAEAASQSVEVEAEGQARMDAAAEKSAEQAATLAAETESELRDIEKEITMQDQALAAADQQQKRQLGADAISQDAQLAAQADQQKAQIAADQQAAKMAAQQPRPAAR